MLQYTSSYVALRVLCCTPAANPLQLQSGSSGFCFCFVSAFYVHRFGLSGTPSVRVNSYTCVKITAVHPVEEVTSTFIHSSIYNSQY